MTSLPLTSIPGLTEVTWQQGASNGPVLVLELPHGATTENEYRVVAEGLKSRLPENLIDFFHVNTDFGTPECAEQIAAFVGRTDPSISVLILRCRLPRTLVDCNRTLEEQTDGMTEAIPVYVDDSEDRRRLSDLHRQYLEQADLAYELAGRRGVAINLHSYAPRSVGINVVDGGIVQALHKAYEPEVYEGWPRRPDIELISSDVHGRSLLSESWLTALRQAYRSAGIPLAENETYHLHDGTLAARYAEDYPGRVLCVEFNRQRLARDYRPFVELETSTDAVTRYVEPLALATLSELASLRG
ncbi:MAG: N-formylglutamate amidohydrolase [Acidobacteriota bacterium]|nr:N-formylglutamate amidohydrolase [Acidobacteriota bacterium]